MVHPLPENPPSPASAPDTRDRILDAAETLFADQGFNQVSLRQITQEAGVNLASVNYHFGSKSALIFEVLSRIIAPINNRRLELLSEAEERAGAGPVEVEEIFRAAFEPVVSLMSKSDHSSTVFMKLAGRCMSESREDMPETNLKVFREVADRFHAAMRRALPHLSREEIYWRVHFSIGAFLYALTQGEQLALFSRGAVTASDPGEMMRQLITYTAAGMRAENERKRKGEPA